MPLPSHVPQRNISGLLDFFNELSEIALLGPRRKNNCIVLEETKYHICSVNIYP